MDVQLTAAHWVYLAGILVILATMALRKNIVVPAVVATFLTALVFSGSIVTGLSSIFNAPNPRKESTRKTKIDVDSAGNVVNIRDS